MIGETELREKLRKIETLFSSAGTTREKTATDAVAERIRKCLKQTEKSVEIQFSLPDPPFQQLFCALCRHYDLNPYRYQRQHHQTVSLSLLHQVL